MYIELTKDQYKTLLKL